MTRNEAILLNLIGDIQRLRDQLKYLAKQLHTTCSKILNDNDMLKAKIESLELELVAEGDENPYGDVITEAEVLECLNDNHVWTKGVFINKPCVCGKVGYAMESLSGGIDVKP